MERTSYQLKPWLPYIGVIGILCLLVVLISPTILMAHANAQPQSSSQTLTAFQARGIDGELLTPTPTHLASPPVLTPTPMSFPFSLKTTPNKTAQTVAPFVGLWIAHYGSIEIKADGHAHLEARTYQWCTDPGSKPPCDSLNGNMIVDGIQEDIVFTAVKIGVAYGKIVKSTLDNTGQPVTAMLTMDDALVISDGNIFCGPQAPEGSCGA
ncbi:hypothetical protein [Dictyobacter arantiisoli]|uniref:Uncharacterized protein n=1 Tax=Dictyobacter arantiisoli TaxID=2014874 RepID=A0A5A5TAJ2_9CHLR|nr:hypothetical protein [Dictyobacter arantiisoli]GCF08511.1 hypothetical protein KDI_20750 [Dictyobacter arantiisoli]